jgi:ferredoxin
MPKVTFKNWNKTVECPPGTNLRKLALEQGIPLYNGIARVLNCRGLGLCGTCCVEVVPEEKVGPKQYMEVLRFFQVKGNFRLACQSDVRGDIEVTKREGLYGTGKEPVKG